MNDIRALILCNNPIAMQGIKEFLFFGKVVGIGVPSNNKEMQHLLKPMLVEANVPLFLLNKKEVNNQLNTSINELKPNVVLLMTFPFIISAEILSKPQNGFINFHYGLLPQCQGPQPILWHMLNNDTEAGVTIHKVDEGIDTGEIIMQEKIAIEQNDTYGILQSKLSYLGAKLAASLYKILSYASFIPSTVQDLSKAKYYKTPTSQDLTINWKKMSASQIVRLVNACNPWNKGAGAIINNWIVGFTNVQVEGDCFAIENEPGAILTCSKENGLVIKTLDNKKLKINIVYTPEGFFTGYRLAEFGIKEGQVFS